jgi:hypothetical protein
MLEFDRTGVLPTSLVCACELGVNLLVAEIGDSDERRALGGFLGGETHWVACVWGQFSFLIKEVGGFEIAAHF